MQTVEIDLGDRSYPIYIGSSLMENPDLLAKHLRGNQVMVVTNETIGPLYRPILEKALSGLNQPLDVRFVTLPDGESHKNLTVLNQIYDALLEARFDRTCTLVALGGGVIGDMAGFAAASYQRGVDFIQMPTSLLAQVDSSVGGKTGVNHAQGKNMIGAFHQPQCVIADTNTLRTLPIEELRSGLAEVIKYGFILDVAFLQWLEKNTDKLLSTEPDALAYAIRRSCEIKADIVAKDEHEHGTRALLNLGHTFGHAIEAAMGYGTWLHGEAVAAGTAMALDLSTRLGWLDPDQKQRGLALIEAIGLPVRSPDSMTSEQFLHYMERDKKSRAGQIRLILLEALGKAVFTKDFDPDALDQTLKHFTT